MHLFSGIAVPPILLNDPLHHRARPPALDISDESIRGCHSARQLLWSSETRKQAGYGKIGSTETIANEIEAAVA